MRFSLVEKTRGDRAYQDDLTGLFNYRLLAELFDDGWEELAATGPLSVLILDLDLFKTVNDTYGHLTGNDVLQASADLLRGSFRADDLLFRYGGDEFVVLCPGVGEAEAVQLAARAREALEAETLHDRDTGEPIAFELSFSLGVASYPAEGATGPEVLAVADQRLLREKERRRVDRMGTARRSRRLFWPGLLVLVILAVSASILLERWAATPFPEVGPRLDSIQLGRERAAVEREERLQEEIGRLQAELAELAQEREVDLETDEETLERYRSRVADLEGRIAGLQESLADEQSALPPEPAPRIEARVPSPEIVTEPVEPVATEPSGAAPAASELPPPAPESGPVAGSDEEETFVPPRLARLAPPVYPIVARRMRKEAQIELRVLVSAEGHVLEVEPVGEPVGMGFDEAAWKAAWTAEFEPATREGEPTEAATGLTVEFRLQ